MGIISLTSENIHQAIAKSQDPILIDFWAYGCPPCDQIQPILEAEEGSPSTTLQFAKINLDDHGVIAPDFNLSSVPTLIVFQHGTEKERYVVPTEDKVREILDNYQR